MEEYYLLCLSNCRERISCKCKPEQTNIHGLLDWELFNGMRRRRKRNPGPKDPWSPSLGRMKSSASSAWEFKFFTFFPFHFYCVFVYCNNRNDSQAWKTNINIDQPVRKRRIGLSSLSPLPKSLEYLFNNMPTTGFTLAQHNKSKSNEVTATADSSHIQRGSANGSPTTISSSTSSSPRLGFWQTQVLIQAFQIVAKEKCT